MSGYGYGGPGPGPSQPQSTFRPPVAAPPSGYQQTGYAAEGSQADPYYGAPQQPYAYGHGQADHQDQIAPPVQHPDLAAQMGGMNLGAGGYAGARGQKKRDRHAHHTLETPQAQSQGYAGVPQPAAPGQQGQFPGQQQQQPAYPSAQQLGAQGDFHGGAPAPAAQPKAFPKTTPLAGAPASSAQGRVDPEQIPSVPWSRDAPAQFYLDHVYPTMEQHLPPPASVPFVAVDQGNASPKYTRLTLNNIPTSAEALATTGLPLGLILQPLAPLQEGEQPIPVIDFGEVGPPRCRRCRAYINPFMTFRSGGNKFVCNMCTFPNDTPPEYFAPTDPSGARVDRAQRPELMLGTVEYTAPKEYWTKAPVPLRWLFLIDVSMEAISKGFLHGFCDGLLRALYGDEEDGEIDGTAETNGHKAGLLPAGAKIGIATFDREAHFYDLNPNRSEPHMTVMPDMEDPFVPIPGGLFVDPQESKHMILKLLRQIPRMFERVKSPEPVLLPALNAALDALQATGGKVVCSLSSLPTQGPGRLFLRDKPELRDTDAEKKLFTTEHPGFTKVGKQMTENGIGVDFFLAAPQGGYLDIATIGYIAERTGGETYYYPNFVAPRDYLRLSKEIKHIITRTTGFQALMKVRCSNGLQVNGYFGNFIQHTFGADLEFGVIDQDKACGVTFSYDGKLDAKLDAHFQSALLYTTADGQRRIRCSNIVASVSENALESMKLADQDAVVSLLSKQIVSRMPDRLLKDIRNQLIEKTIDILSAYRKNFSGSHPPGQLVLPENLKEFAMYMLGLVKSRALKAGQEPTDRRVHDMRLIKSMGPSELSLYLYPRIIALHSLDASDGFPNENGYLRMPPMVRASYSRIEEGGAYLIDCGQSCLLWLHSAVSPNLLEDLFGEGRSTLHSLDAFASSLPVLETHLNAQVRNILQYLEDNRGSKGMAIQLARQGLDGADYEFARLLYEDRNNEERSYVDWLVHLHRHIQMELQGQRRKENTGESTLASFTGLRAPYW